ncbi:hypothetical protein [Cupriavidus oxalaticus]|uniref:Uncharacterized protein n=1 Tax=Cupriavidus oxalaticus TaxID=96344 RepID=A0A375GNW4_9BURK|nr:hypothetical protein [Cupriavidus oxalaticus]QEZ43248.1 hypothetical protein D2917_02705 [Cupriavidus oxalaticus]QRQ85365.1 hypothetical protein JTE91_04635 [Cupriavidus oxalaticus]QRQ90547.1 hypothetical protein JTE92_07710 [Cupriavidus oxalaticus]WQD85068.1 hypothetical protein U0036_25835 [Cupriavidus oxalaticus]SPC24153.1 conserved exported hypothetical protein [Cupriavidus oxalaticus]
MKRTLATTALVVGTALCLPAFAQQAPASPTAPNPSAPPIEGAGASRNQPVTPGMSTAPAATDMTTAPTDTTKDTAKKSKSKSGKQADTARSKKPREQGAPAAPTADAPSGPKGDTPDPAPKQ